MAKKGVCSIPGCIKTGILRRGFCEPHYDRLMKHGSPHAGGTFRGVPLAWLRNRIGWTGDDCLIWPYAIKNKGYGAVKFHGRDEYCHRLMCEWAHGPAPTAEHEVAHSCGRGHHGCVNPRHLRWATRIENQQDRFEHGTSNRGTRANNCVFSEDDIREVRRLKGRLTQVEIAERFGVSRGAIRAVHSGKTWGWLP